MRMPAEPNRFLHRFAWFTAGATLFLICSGGMVTSKGVGLAVPDWPTTFGYNMFFFPVSQWVGGIFFEHTHRLIASVVGFLTIILAVWLWRAKSRAGSKRSVGSSLGAVILQGVLGGLRVTLLKDQIGIFHACLAQAFLWLARLHRARDLAALATARTPSATLPQPVARPSCDRHYRNHLWAARPRRDHAPSASRSFDPGFPARLRTDHSRTDPATIARVNQARDAQALSDVTAGQIWLQMAHRFGAAIIGLTIVWFWFLVRRERLEHSCFARPLEPLARAHDRADRTRCMDDLE